MEELGENSQPGYMWAWRRFPALHKIGSLSVTRASQICYFMVILLVSFVSYS